MEKGYVILMCVVEWVKKESQAYITIPVKGVSVGSEYHGGKDKGVGMKRRIG